MTETSITNDAITPDEFDAWLAGASLAQGSVEILQNPALLAQWDDLKRRYERAQQIVKGEGGIADDNPIPALEVEAEQLLEDIEASRTVLHVRALIPDDDAAILAAHPITPGPSFTGKIPSVQPNPTENQAKAFLGMYAMYEAELNRWQAENAEAIEAHRKTVMDALQAQGAEKVSRAVVRVEQGGRLITEHLSVDQVIKLWKAIGEPQGQKILAKINEVSQAAPEVPAGFLSRTSGNDLA